MRTGHAQRRQRDDRGLTAAELLIAAVITILILLMTSSFFLSATTAVTTSRNAALDSGTASNAMIELTRVLRSGSPNPVINNSVPDPIFLAGSAESVTIYSYADASVSSPSPMIMQFTVDATTRQLVEKRWAATGNAGGYFTFPDYTTATPTWQRTIAGPIATTPTGKPPLFVYLASTGAVTVGGTGLTLAQRTSLVSVQVTVRVNASGYVGATGVELQNTVGLPNLGLGN